MIHFQKHASWLALYVTMMTIFEKYWLFSFMGISRKRFEYGNPFYSPFRGKKILEQVSRPRFLQGFEFSRAFHPCETGQTKVREILKPCKNDGLETCFNIFLSDSC